MPHQSKAGSETERVEETYTMDLAARFEAKREECEKKAQVAFREWNVTRGDKFLARSEAFAEARDMARADAAGGAGEEAKKPRDPVRSLKEALFDCVKAGFDRREYGGVLVAEGKFAWVRFTIEPPRPAPAPPLQGGVSSPLGEGEPYYTPGVIHYPDDDRLEFVAADVATVARYLGGGCAVLLNMETREPVGFYIEQASKTVPASLAALGTGEGSGGASEPDIVSYLHRQWAWSKETFGPALRTKGIVQHITKELREIEAEPHDLAEWVDVIILAMDGFWRHGGKPEDLLPAMQAKQDRNFARTWPDWRTIGEDQAIEHDRSGEVK